MQQWNLFMFMAEDIIQYQKSNAGGSALVWIGLENQPVGKPTTQSIVGTLDVWSSERKDCGRRS